MTGQYLTARAFTSAREEQAELHGRTISTFDEAVGNAVLRATTLARSSVGSSEHKN